MKPISETVIDDRLEEEIVLTTLRDVRNFAKGILSSIPYAAIQKYQQIAFKLVVALHLLDNAKEVDIPLLPNGEVHFKKMDKDQMSFVKRVTRLNAFVFLQDIYLSSGLLISTES